MRKRSAERSGEERVRDHSADVIYLLGWIVGLGMATLPSLSICSNVVFPALSNPKKRILAFL